MKSFSQFLVENGLNQDVSSADDYNLEKEFSVALNSFHIDLDKQYSIYPVSDFYYLVKEGKYAGYVQNYDYTIKKGTINIVGAHIKERGDYKRLLLGLFEIKKIKRIVSDSILSTPATKFWQKIIDDNSIKKVIMDNNEKAIWNGKKLGPDELELFKDEEHRIGILK